MIFMNMRNLPNITVSVFFVMCCLAPKSSLYAQFSDSASVYFKAKQFLTQGNHDFYKFGNVKPKNIEDAFCVFLTGNEVRLQHFKNLGLEDAVVYGLNKENGIMRYDWGCESFRDFSQYCILKYELWAPSLQYNLALRCFHFWMNEKSPLIPEMATNLRSANKTLNKKWKTRYLEFTRYANNEQLKGRAKRKHQRFLRKSRACGL